jgi:hypothetical protein
MGSFIGDTVVTMVDGRLIANLSRDWDIWRRIFRARTMFVSATRAHYCC